MNLRRTELMSRLRGERQSAPSQIGRERTERAEKNARSKKEKWVKMTGWERNQLPPEDDFSWWAKKTEAVDMKESRGFPSKREWDPYVCTLLKKCRALDNVEDYVSQSLSITLKPPKKEPEITKVPLKHSKSENFIKSKALDSANKTGDMLKESMAKENKPPSVQNDKDSEKNNLVPNGITEEPSKDATTKADKNTVINEKDQKLIEKPPKPPDLSAENPEKKTETPRTKPEAVYIPPRFGYTQSNKTSARGSSIYDSDASIRALNALNNKHLTESENAEYETISDISSISNYSSIANRSKGNVKPRRTLNTTNVGLIPGYKGPVSNSRSRVLQRNGMSRSETNLYTVPDEQSQVKNIDVRRLENDSMESITGMSVVSIKSARSVKSSPRIHPHEQDNTLHSRSYQDFSGVDPNIDPASQKQVLLVLKKVTLQDEDIDPYAVDNANGALVKRSALTSAIARKYGLLHNGPQPQDTASENTVTNKPPTNKVLHIPRSQNSSAKSTGQERDKTVSSSMGSNFPLGELLPAVDVIRNSMPARHHRSVSDQNGYSDKNGLTVSGKDKMFPYEDNIIMMKEGVEMVRIRQQNEAVASQGFRPPPGKTPLHRARENAHKRLYTQLDSQMEPGKRVPNGDAPHAVSGNKTRWESSTGALYNDTNSRPSSVKYSEHSTSTDRLQRRWRESAMSDPPSGGGGPHHGGPHGDSGRALNVENSRLQMQHVSKALANRLNHLAKQQTTQATINDLITRAGVK